MSEQCQKQDVTKRHKLTKLKC